MTQHLNARAQTTALIGKQVRGVIDTGKRRKLQCRNPNRSPADKRATLVFELAGVHVGGETEVTWIAVERLGVAEVEAVPATVREVWA